jgi:hypothetical protein
MINPVLLRFQVLQLRAQKAIDFPLFLTPVKRSHLSQLQRVALTLIDNSKTLTIGLALFMTSPDKNQDRHLK